MIFTDPKSGEQDLEEAETALLHQPETSRIHRETIIVIGKRYACVRVSQRARIELSLKFRVSASLPQRIAKPMIFSDDMELAVALYMAENALPRHAAIKKLLQVGLQDTGYLTGGAGRPAEIVDGQPSADYVQYGTYLDGDN